MGIIARKRKTPDPESNEHVKLIDKTKSQNPGPKTIRKMQKDLQKKKIDLKK